MGKPQLCTQRPCGLQYLPVSAGKRTDGVQAVGSADVRPPVIAFPRPVFESRHVMHIGKPCKRTYIEHFIEKMPFQNGIHSCFMEAGILSVIGPFIGLVRRIMHFCARGPFVPGLIQKIRHQRIAFRTQGDSLNDVQAVPRLQLLGRVPAVLQVQTNAVDFL